MVPARLPLSPQFQTYRCIAPSDEMDQWAIASGGRSALAGMVLKDMGYGQVYNMGAFKDWADNGGTIEKPIDMLWTAPPPTGQALWVRSGHGRTRCRSAMKMRSVAKMVALSWRKSDPPSRRLQFGVWCHSNRRRSHEHDFAICHLGPCRHCVSARVCLRLYPHYRCSEFDSGGLCRREVRGATADDAARWRQRRSEKLVQLSSVSLAHPY